jgi:hypothetical protein
MFWSIDALITWLIIVLSMWLFAFWCMRARLILMGSEEEINLVLDRDFEWSRKIWLVF